MWPRDQVSSQKTIFNKRTSLKISMENLQCCTNYTIAKYTETQDIQPVFSGNQWTCSGDIPVHLGSDAEGNKNIQISAVAYGPLFCMWKLLRPLSETKIKNRWQQIVNYLKINFWILGRAQFILALMQIQTFRPTERDCLTVLFT